METMQSKTLFQDAMDQERVVKVVGQQGRSLECKVYWKSAKGLNFGGTTFLPAGLFEETPQNKRIGFYPLNKKD